MYKQTGKNECLCLIFMNVDYKIIDGNNRDLSSIVLWYQRRTMHTELKYMIKRVCLPAIFKLLALI